LAALARTCNLTDDVILQTIKRLDDRRKATEKALTAEAKKIGAVQLGTDILELMERSWNGSISSIGPFLSKKQSAADKE